MNFPWIGCHTYIGVDPAFYVRGHFPYAQDYCGLVEQASRNGMSKLIAFPFVTYFGLERHGRLANTWSDVSAHATHCDAVLADRMMWGSDAPFYSYAASHDGDTLRLFSTYEREIAAFSLLSEVEKTAVTHHNILRFLGVSHG